MLPYNTNENEWLSVKSIKEQKKVSFLYNLISKLDMNKNIDFGFGYTEKHDILVRKDEI
jgi:hypothetical protein